MVARLRATGHPLRCSAQGTLPHGRCGRLPGIGSECSLILGGHTACGDAPHFFHPHSPLPCRAGDPVTTHTPPYRGAWRAMGK